MVWKKGASVAIWGSGLNAEKVYVKYAGKYDIRIVVDNFKNKESIFNKKIVSAEDFFCNDEFRGLKIIIASDKWKEIAEQLRSKGLRAGEDFLPYIMLDTREIFVTTMLELCEKREIGSFLDRLKENRKIVIFWGNCQINGVREFCKGNEEFCKRYFIVTFPKLWLNDELVNLADCKQIWEKCDLLIVQRIGNNSQLDIKCSTEYRKKFLIECNPRSNLVYMPNLRFEGYYPQLGQETVVALKKMHWEGVQCRDSNIIRMIDEGLNDEQIIELIESEDYYSEKEVIEYFNKWISDFKMFEKECDIQIGDFLEQNVILYYSPYHPRAEVIYEMTLRLLRFLGIKNLLIYEYKRIGIRLERINYFHRTEYVYPSVLKALKIRQYENSYKMNAIIYDTGEQGRDVLESYIALCRGYRGETTI